STALRPGSRKELVGNSMDSPDARSDLNGADDKRLDAAKEDRGSVSAEKGNDPPVDGGSLDDVSDVQYSRVATAADVEEASLVGVDEDDAASTWNH
ncbi:MAG: hypothetical protein L6R42_009552, partial [Xanthoria sp. 1 TBL-2021]